MAHKARVPFGPSTGFGVALVALLMLVWFDARLASAEPFRLPWFSQGLPAGHPLAGVVDALSRGDDASARRLLLPVLASEPKLPLTHELDGFLCSQSGDLPGAESAFRRALTLNTTPRVVHAALGEVQFLQGKFRDARTNFQTYLQVRPSDSMTHFYLGRLAVLESDRARAMTHFESAAGKLDNVGQRALFALVSLHISGGELARAKTRLVKCVPPCAGTPGHIYVSAQIDRAEGKSAEAESKLLTVAKTTPLAGDVWLELAALREDRGDFAGAEQGYERAAASPEWKSAANLASAAAKMRRGDRSRAMPILTRMVLDERFPQAYVLLAEGLAQEKRHAEAGQVLANLVREYPRYAQGHLMLGLWHIGQRQSTQAVPRLRKAVQLQPDLVQGWIHLSNIESVAHRTKEAESLLRAGLNSAPKNPELHYYLGLELEQQSRWAEAAQAYADAIAAKPDFWFAMNNRARMLVRAGGDLAEAERLMRAVIKQMPSALATGNLGWVLIHGGKLSEGVPLVEQAVAALPENPELHFYLSVGYQKQGKVKEAANALAHAHSKGLSKTYAKTGH